MDAAVQVGPGVAEEAEGLIHHPHHHLPAAQAVHIATAVVAHANGGGGWLHGNGGGAIVINNNNNNNHQHQQQHHQPHYPGLLLDFEEGYAQLQSLWITPCFQNFVAAGPLPIEKKGSTQNLVNAYT